MIYVIAWQRCARVLLRLWTTLGLAIALPCATPAQAPIGGVAPAGVRSARDLVTVGVAVEPALVFTLGYLHRLGAAGAGEHAWWVGPRLEVPITVLHHDAWRLDLMGTTSVGDARAWAMPASGSIFHNRNRAGSMLGVGTEIRIAPGRYGTHGSFALDLGWQETWRTRIRHAATGIFEDRYPDGGDAGVAGPVDGWYGRTVSRWRLGLAGSRDMGRGTWLQLATGALVVTQRQGVILGFDLAQIPFYLEATVARR